MEEGKRELEVLVRRREDINAEISRVQDVLEALESFEAPGGKDGGVKAGARCGLAGSSATGGCGGSVACRLRARAAWHRSWQAVRRSSHSKEAHSPDQTRIRSMTRRFGP